MSIPKYDAKVSRVVAAERQINPEVIAIWDTRLSSAAHLEELRDFTTKVVIPAPHLTRQPREAATLCVCVRARNGGAVRRLPQSSVLRGLKIDVCTTVLTLLRSASDFRELYKSRRLHGVIVIAGQQVRD